MTADQVPAPARRRLSLYQRVTDAVSYAQGTPANLTFWLIVIGGWIAFGPELAHATFLPGWMGSPTWNFPVNTGTSICELFIGFLVSASTNRSERNLETTLGRITGIVTAIKDVLAGVREAEDRDAETEAKLSDAIAANTRLTTEVHELTKAVHAAVVSAGGAVRHGVLAGRPTPAGPGVVGSDGGGDRSEPSAAETSRDPDSGQADQGTEGGA